MDLAKLTLAELEALKQQIEREQSLRQYHQRPASWKRLVASIQNYCREYETSIWVYRNDELVGFINDSDDFSTIDEFHT